MSKLMTGCYVPFPTEDTEAIHCGPLVWYVGYAWYLQIADERECNGIKYDAEFELAELIVGCFGLRTIFETLSLAVGTEGCVVRKEQHGDDVKWW